MNIDGYTGLPALPEDYYWHLYEYQFDPFYSDDVEWRLAIYKRRRFWFNKFIKSVALAPEYKRDTWQNSHDTFAEYLVDRAKVAFNKAFKLTPEDESRRQWLGDYPPKSVINDGRD